MSYNDLDIRGYFITFTTYGTWVHGDQRGSVDKEHKHHSMPKAPPMKRREKANRASMKWPAFTLNAKARGVVDKTIREVCEHRGWELIRLNVRTNHVHLVVWTRDPASKVMKDIKAWCTRRLREAGCVEAEQEVWTEGGSMRKLFTEEALRNAIEYVVNGQGPDLPRE